MYTPEQGVVVSSFTNTTSYQLDMITPVVISQANAHKLGIIVYNNDATIFIKLGDNAASDDFSYRLPSGSTLEVNYAGKITGIANSTPSTVMVTEML